MDMQDVLDGAPHAIATFAEMAVRDPASYRGGRDGPGEIAAAAAALRARLVPARDVLAAAYRPGHEAAAALIVHAALDGEGYATLMAEVGKAYGKDMDPHTLDGLWAMDGFLKSIGDDHDWIFDAAASPPTIRLQGTIDRHEPLLNPASLRDALATLLIEPAPSRAM